MNNKMIKTSAEIRTKVMALIEKGKSNAEILATGLCSVSLLYRLRTDLNMPSHKLNRAKILAIAYECVSTDRQFTDIATNHGVGTRPQRLPKRAAQQVLRWQNVKEVDAVSIDQTIETKLDQIVGLLSNIQDRLTALEKRISRIEKRLKPEVEIYNK